MQFLSYKERSESKLKLFDDMKEKLTVAEALLSQRFPVDEANYGIDDLTPLRLYNCMVPTLKEHRLIKPDLNNCSEGRYDIKYLRDLRRLEHEIAKTDVQYYIENNAIKEHKIK